MYALNRLPRYKLASSGRLSPIARAKVKLYHSKAPCRRYEAVHVSGYLAGVGQNTAVFSTSQIYSGRTRTNFGLRFAIPGAHRSGLIRIHKTGDRHHTKIPRKKFWQFDFQFAATTSQIASGRRDPLRPARAGVATTRGPRAGATVGWPTSDGDCG